MDGDGMPVGWTTSKHTEFGQITTAQVLNNLLSLEENWDSYGASPISTCAMGVLERFLYRLKREVPDAYNKAQIVPTNRGGAQVEWHDRGRSLEIDLICEEGDFTIYCEDVNGKDSAEYSTYAMDDAVAAAKWWAEGGEIPNVAETSELGRIAW